MRHATALLLILLGGLAAAADDSLVSGGLDGRWEGAISIVGQRLGIVVHLETNAGVLEAFIDIPQQAASGLPLGNVRHEGDRLHMELVAGPGLAVFDGEVEGDTIAGQFTQSGLQGTFELARAAEPPAAQPQPEPAPYREEPVTFSSGDVRLAGTLTLPEGEPPHRAVVLIGGSGPQDRDSNVFGFPLFATLADRLARAGIAVLRYDDRGVGGSSGSTMQSTTEDFAADVAAALETLAARGDIDGDRIGLLGISEGGLVAPLVAVRHPGKVALVVLMAAPALDGQAILEAQAAALARAQGAGEEDIEKNLAIQRSIFAAVRGEKSWDQVDREMDETIRAALAAAPESQRAAITDEDALVRAQIEAQLGMARTPWFRFFLDYDPAVTLRALKATPVLALYGERDLQVPAEMNRKAMAEALRLAGNPGVEIRVVPGANHLFQAAKTGSAREYATLPKEFAPGVVEAIAGFILRHTPRPSASRPGPTSQLD